MVTAERPLAILDNCQNNLTVQVGEGKKSAHEISPGKQQEHTICLDNRITLSRINMENGCVGKTTPIGGTHFSLNHD